jgi:hypothetical protein
VEPRATVASVSLKIGAFANVHLPRVAAADEMRAMFDPEVAVDDTLRLMRHYDIAYVLNYTPHEPTSPKRLRQAYGLEPDFVFADSKFDRWPDRFEVVISDGPWRLYRVRSSAAAGRAGGDAVWRNEELSR